MGRLFDNLRKTNRVGKVKEFGKKGRRTYKVYVKIINEKIYMTWLREVKKLIKLYRDPLSLRDQQKDPNVNE